MSYSGDPFPPVPTDQTDSSFFYRQRRLARSAFTPTTDMDVGAIARVENLAAAFTLMGRENGQAPGPDGLTYPEVGRRELFDILRPVSQAILAGTYRPGPARQVQIPKDGNRGFRTLTLRNLIDRTVAKAVNEAMVPFWEKIFLDGSHGFRPGRSQLTMLAHLQRVVTEQNRWVIVSDDVRNAFDSVSIDLLMQNHRRHLANNENLLNLVEAVLRGGDPNKKVGIDQGSPYMPTALNVHLHHVLDAHVLGANPGTLTSSLRFADNLVEVCKDVAEGKEVLCQIVSRLQSAGLALKGDNGGQPVDLCRGGNVHLLGFVLFKQGKELCYKLDPGAWDNLQKSLLKAHETSHPVNTAQAVLQGWIASHGPAFRKRQNRTVVRLLQLASSLGFRETCSPDLYERECRCAWLRWRALLLTYRGTSTERDSK